MNDTRTIHGKTVVADQPTAAPFTSNDGNQVYWQQIRTLLLHTGEVIFGCAHCTYTNTNLYSVRPHLNAHRTDKKHQRRTNGAPAGDSSDTLRGLLEQLSNLEQIQHERDEWKRRAQKAERSLRAVRNALGSDQT